MGTGARGYKVQYKYDILSFFMLVVVIKLYGGEENAKYYELHQGG